jgi:predicted nucleic acid-binding protein
VNEYVLDASVAAKWLLPPDNESLADKSLQALRQFRAGTLSFVVPDLFWSEMGNIFSKAVQTRRMPVRAAEIAFASLLGITIPTQSSIPLLSSALQIALQFQTSFYDSVYLAIAKSSGRPLLTADERLANAVAAYLPVRWLGAI